MQENRIKNWGELATTENRKFALSIVEAGLSAIDTQNVIASTIKLQNDTLTILGKNFDLTKFKNIKVIGFGKASCDGALALEKILGSKINEGVVIGLSKTICEHIETFAGTHPRPSLANIEATKRIYKTIKDSKEDDLIIVLVSGGGSALLCSTESECEQGIKLYDEFLGSGKTITEINTVRKHLSLLKGGGLAKAAYPATVIGLIFSDIPGNDFKNVASGPTFKDETTIKDAKKIIEENNLGDYYLIETPKEDKYFEKVNNFVLVSNETALEAMVKKGEEFHLKTKIISYELYDEIDVAVEKIFLACEENSLVLAAGEPRVDIKNNTGKGGRNLHMSLQAIRNKKINQNSVFISFASDGIDNSDVAGAIADTNTEKKAEAMGLDADKYFNQLDSYSFFQKTNDMIVTGPTGANVSDLMMLLTKNV